MPKVRTAIKKTKNPKKKSNTRAGACKKDKNQKGEKVPDKILGGVKKGTYKRLSAANPMERTA